jgi:hypothetical protein
MSYLKGLEFNRPPIFNCVAKGLAASSLNPAFCNTAAAPLRFIAALVVVAVSPPPVRCLRLVDLCSGVHCIPS